MFQSPGKNGGCRSAEMRSLVISEPDVKLWISALINSIPLRRAVTIDLYIKSLQGNITLNLEITKASDHRANLTEVLIYRLNAAIPMHGAHQNTQLPRAADKNHLDPATWYIYKHDAVLTIMLNTASSKHTTKSTPASEHVQVFVLKKKQKHQNVKLFCWYAEI